MRVRFTIYNEEVENTVNDRLKKKLLCFERALSTLEGYEGWMIGTTTLHLDWQPKQGENEFCHTKLTPEIIKKGRSAIRVRIAVAEEEKERENEEMEVLLVKPRQSVLVPEKEKMPLMKAITELGSEDDDTLVFSRSQMEEFLCARRLNCWKIIPIDCLAFRISASFIIDRFCPSKITRPAVGVSR